MEISNQREEREPATHFASPLRARGEELERTIAAACKSEAVSAILRYTGCAALVLNAHRQVIAANHEYLALAGISDPAAAVGLRPGEIARCAYEPDAPSGCGTAVPCATCGLALAVVLAQRDGADQTAECALRFGDLAHPSELSLEVRAHSLRLGEAPCVLVLLRDVSAEKRRAALESSFRHDLKNVAMGLVGTAEMLAFSSNEETEELARDIKALSMRLAAEIELHAAMNAERPSMLPIRPRRTRLSAILSDLERLLAFHPASAGKRVELPRVDASLDLETDPVLLERVLLNLSLNALEASAPGEAIRIGVEAANGRIAFTVWNRGEIPAAVRPRIFQRYFSTKQGAARGQGTYAARLVGEEYLGGRLFFTTSDEAGTVFCLELGLPPAAEGRTASPR